MTAVELEDVLSLVPPDTPVIFQIEGVEAHCSSAIIEHEPYIFPARGELVPITDLKVKHVLLEVGYGT
jgi:hypothetical protein